jgi:hypothetical protein
MCPDRQLLSVYLDGEMPSPWKEKLEEHLAGCSLCAKKLEEYERLSIKPGKEEEAYISAVKDRVWQKLEPQSTEVKITRYPSREGIRPRYTENLWQRRISIPLPAAAAAAAILVIAALAFIITPRSTGVVQPTTMSIASEAEFEIPGIIPIADMESVLQYLGMQDSNEVLILRLPENRNFINYSEPTIIKAADYSQQTNRPARRRP